MASSSRHPAGSTDIEHRPPGDVDRAYRPYSRGLRPLSLATVATWSVALGLVFFYAPLEADQGFVQKIFYVHVPLAIVSLCGWVLGGVLAIQYLRTRDARWDVRSYVAIHMSLIFGVGTLITGSIWAKASWGHWWVWDEPTLVSFLIVFLLYATYQPLRFSIEDPERQSRYAAVFAIAAGAFVPLNFAAVRMSTGYVHPRVLGDTSSLPGQMALTFGVSLLAMALLWATLCKYEMTAKHARAQLRALRRKLSGETAMRGRSAAPTLHATPGGPAPSPRPAGASATTATPAVGRPSA
jgi:heme exporter protein C